jgi:hypothetical protein
MKDGEHTDYDDMALLPKMVHEGFYDGLLSFREDSSNVYFRRFWRMYLDGSYGERTGESNISSLVDCCLMLDDTGTDRPREFAKISHDFAEAYRVTDDVVQKNRRRREYSRDWLALYDLPPKDRPILNLKDLMKDESRFTGKYTRRKLENYFKPDNYIEHRLKCLKGDSGLIALVWLCFRDWVSIEYNGSTNGLFGLSGFGHRVPIEVGYTICKLREKMVQDVLIEELYDFIFRDMDETFINEVVNNYNAELETKLTLDEIKPHLRFHDRTKEMEDYIRRKRIERISKNPKLRGYYDNWSMNK